jgi:hypothetical protein
MNQQGYSRLYGVLSMLFITVVSVLIYQSVVYRTDRVEVEVLAEEFTRVQVFPSKLPIISRGAYELWVTTETEDISLGKFILNAEGELENSIGVIEDSIFPLPELVEEVRGGKITISESLDPRTEDNVLFLEGDLSKDRVALAFPQSFQEASGRFMLATPTDNNTLINERSGLWFGDVLRNNPALDLPALPDGWVYEGWAVLEENVTLTSGRFINDSSPDRFAGFSDTQGSAPGFPGEDFLKDPPVAVFPDLSFPLDLAGGRVEITIEPETLAGDPTGAGKFPFPVLQTNIPRRAEALQFIELLPNEELPSSLLVFR